MHLSIAFLASLLLLSCSGSDPEARRPVGPPSSETGNQPWNDPSQGPTPAGPGGMLERR